MVADVIPAGAPTARLRRARRRICAGGLRLRHISLSLGIRDLAALAGDDITLDLVRGEVSGGAGQGATGAVALIHR